MVPLPGTKTPDLKLPLISGVDWHLSAQSPDFMTMIVFYRGLHCPACKAYLEKLQTLAGDFAGRGVGFVAISTDSEERAKQAYEEWDMADVPIGYGFDLEAASDWGLLVSEAIKEDEPDHFVEPGLFLVRPDGTLFFAAVQSMPFARPSLDDILSAVDFVKEEDYPPRGTSDRYR